MYPILLFLDSNINLMRHQLYIGVDLIISKRSYNHVIKCSLSFTTFFNLNDPCKYTTNFIRINVTSRMFLCRKMIASAFSLGAKIGNLGTKIQSEHYSNINMQLFVYKETTILRKGSWTHSAHIREIQREDYV